MGIGRHDKKIWVSTRRSRWMKDGVARAMGFLAAESGLDRCQRDIVAPGVFGTQVVAAAFEQVTAIDGFGFLFALLLFGPGELRLLLVVSNEVITRDPGVTLLRAPDGFVNLGGRPQAACNDAARLAPF